VKIIIDKQKERLWPDILRINTNSLSPRGFNILSEIHKILRRMAKPKISERSSEEYVEKRSFFDSLQS
jgi:hypothetical protein